MPVIIFDGPEAAGKTTLIRKLFARTDHKIIRGWGPVSSIREYFPPLMADLDDSRTVVWDRSWASEFVYNRLLNRGRELEPELTVLEALPILKVMVLTDPELMADRRERRIVAGEGGDLPVDPFEEWQEFNDYAIHHGWAIIEPQLEEKEQDNAK